MHERYRAKKEYGHLGGWGHILCHPTSLYDHLPKDGFVSRTLNSILNGVWDQDRKQLPGHATTTIITVL
jgi:hypothetical protein